MERDKRCDMCEMRKRNLKAALVQRKNEEIKIIIKSSIIANAGRSHTNQQGSLAV